MTINQMELKAKELKELKNMRDELDEEIKALEDELKEEMDFRGVEELPAGPFKIRFKAIISNRFDTKAFKATHAELYSQYAKESKSRRFSIA